MTRTLNIAGTIGGIMFLGLVAYECVAWADIWREIRRERL